MTVAEQKRIALSAGPSHGEEMRSTVPSGTCKLRDDYLFTDCARLGMGASSNATIIDSSQAECSISALGVCSV
jgi:hypothetical protein